MHSAEGGSDSGDKETSNSQNGEKQYQQQREIRMFVSLFMFFENVFLFPRKYKRIYSLFSNLLFILNGI